MSSKSLLLGSVLAAAIGSLVTPYAAHAGAKATMKMLDTDSDGTVSLQEVETAATKKFEMLDPDRDSTIDKKEAKGTLKKGAFKKADPDKDGTIDEKEYTGLVDELFKKADKDGDGTLDAKELKSKPGKKLLKLVE